ncbi:MAG: isoamylase [Nocardioidaceae bacterium]|nr:isoamylase [Nocardioidaceae bacterium]
MAQGRYSTQGWVTTVPLADAGTQPMGGGSTRTKLLLDPYARAIHGDVEFAPPVFGRGTGDSAPHMPRSLVIASSPGPGRGPRHPRAGSVVYELHVRGFTMRHPGVPEALRGTYAGLAHPAALEHLTRLGVTAVELLPVHHNVPEPFLRAVAASPTTGVTTPVPAGTAGHSGSR